MRQNYLDLVNEINLFSPTILDFLTPPWLVMASFILLGGVCGCAPFFKSNIAVVKGHFKWIATQAIIMSFFVFVFGIISFAESITAAKLSFGFLVAGGAYLYTAFMIVVSGNWYASLHHKIRALKLKKGSEIFVIGLSIIICLFVRLLTKFLPAFVIIIVCSVIVFVGLPTFLIRARPK